MTRDQLIAAPDATVALINDQAEKRLVAQCAFADVQDARGASLSTSAVSLAAAATGIAATSASVAGAAAPLTIGAVVATFGFSVTAGLTMWALRSCNFDSPGWFPADFSDDLDNGRTPRDLAIDFALDFQIRLSRNKRALLRRGNIFNWATGTMLGTPIAALIASLIAA